MAKSAKPKRGKGNFMFDGQDLAIFADYRNLKHNESLDGLSKKYGVTTRTIQRIVDKMEKIFDILDRIAPRELKKIPEPPPAAAVGEKKEPLKESPGPISQGVQGALVKRQGSQAVVLPKDNPLSGIQDLGDLSKVGVHTGILLGGAVVNIRDAVVREDIPFENRMLMMSQGSVVVANAALTVLEMMRSLGRISSRPIKEISGDGGE